MIDRRPPLLIEVRGMQPVHRVGAWRELVADVVAGCCREHGRVPGPVMASFEFILRRPPTHFDADGQLHSDAPTFCGFSPDLSKLVRATEEALSRRLIDDRSRIAISHAFKRYCDPGEEPGAILTIERIGQQPAGQSAFLS